MNLLSFIATFLATISAIEAGNQFSPADSSKSPDGKWELICKAPANSEGDQRHVLLLKRIQGGTFELRRVEGSSCLALWSPDSSHIAVTDFWASDKSDVLIYLVAQPPSERSLAKLFPGTAIPSEELSGHCYFEALKWLNRHRLQIRISGHRDEYPANNFEYEFIFDLASGRFTKVMRKKPNESMERTGANRLAHLEFVSQGPLVPTAHADRYAENTKGPENGKVIPKTQIEPREHGSKGIENYAC